MLHLCWISTDTNVISLNEPDVPFPPACPTVHNLAAICHSGHGRPRYPPNFFPGSRFSHFRRRGSAINRLESWFSLCCSGQVARQSHLILCCTRQAVSLYCVCVATKRDRGGFCIHIDQQEYIREIFMPKFLKKTKQQQQHLNLFLAVETSSVSVL